MEVGVPQTIAKEAPRLGGLVEKIEVSVDGGVRCDEAAICGPAMRDLFSTPYGNVTIHPANTAKGIVATLR